MNTNTASRRSIDAFGMALIASLLLTPSGNAQSFGNTNFRPFAGNVSLRQDVVKSLPKELTHINVKSAFDGAWTSARADLIKNAKTQLGKRRFGGQSLHDIDIRLAKQGQLLAHEGVVTGFQYVLKGNRITSSMTTPDIAFGFGLGRGADPRFSIDFDLIVTMDVQPSMNGIVVKMAKVEVNAKRPKGANLTGDLAQAGVDVFHFFGGGDLRGIARDAINRQNVDISGRVTRALAPLNAGLAKARQAVPRAYVLGTSFEGPILVLRVQQTALNPQAPVLR